MREVQCLALAFEALSIMRAHICSPFPVIGWILIRERERPVSTAECVINQCFEKETPSPRLGCNLGQSQLRKLVCPEIHTSTSRFEGVLKPVPQVSAQKVSLSRTPQFLNPYRRSTRFMRVPLAPRVGPQRATTVHRPLPSPIRFLPSRLLMGPGRTMCA